MRFVLQGVNVTEYCLGGGHQKPLDYHTLRGSKMEDNVGHPGCPEGQSLSGKENSLSDGLGTLSDANVGLEKHMRKSDNEIEGCKSEKLAEGERIAYVSSTDCTKDNDYNLKQQSCVNSASNAVPLWISPVKSYVEVSAPFLEGNASTKKSFMSSDGCLDGVQPIETNQLEDRKIYGYPLNIGESELKAAVQTSFHDKQCKSESSSSNSTQLIRQACSSDSCQEMSVDNKSCKNVKLSAIDTSTCTDFNIEEPAFRSLVLDTTNLSSGKQCNVIKHSEPIHNIRTRASDKGPDLTSDDNCGTVENISQLKSDLPKKKGAEIPDRAETPYDLDDALDMAQRVAKEVEQEVEASGSSSSMEVSNSDMVHLSYANSADSDKEGCLTEAGSIQQQCNEQDKSDSFSSAKEAVDLKLLTKKEQFCLVEAKEPLHNVVPGINDGFRKQEPSMRPEGSGDQTGHVFGIDLDEDVLENEVEHPEKLVKEAASICENVSKPIPMVAKSGICLPVPQFQSSGELSGWRGSSATSAFRRTSFSESCSKNKALSTNDTIGSSNYSHVKGIDLNVAAGVDFDVELLPKKSIPALSSNYTKESSVEVSSRQARMFDIDLNCVSENDENCHQLSTPASLSSHSVRDFDLNDNPISADACVDPYWPCEGTRALGNGGFDDPAISSVENSRQSDCKSFRSSCSPHLSSMEGFSHSHHAKPFLVAATNMLPSNEQMQRIVTLQHKASVTQSHPHAFLYNNGLYFDPNNGVSSTVYPPPVLPYMTDPHATTVIPQILGSGTLSLFSGAPHLMEVPHGSSPSDFAFIRPTFDLNAGANCPENGIRGTSARQLCIPLSNSTREEQMKSFQQVALTATPMKRREPDGGWDSHQLCLGQAASWR